MAVESEINAATELCDVRSAIEKPLLSGPGVSARNPIVKLANSVVVFVCDIESAVDRDHAFDSVEPCGKRRPVSVRLLIVIIILVVIIVVIIIFVRFARDVRHCAIRRPRCRYAKKMGRSQQRKR